MNQLTFGEKLFFMMGCASVPMALPLTPETLRENILLVASEITENIAEGQFAVNAERTEGDRSGSDAAN